MLGEGRACAAAVSQIRSLTRYTDEHSRSHTALPCVVTFVYLDWVFGVASLNYGKVNELLLPPDTPLLTFHR